MTTSAAAVEHRPGLDVLVEQIRRRTAEGADPATTAQAVAEVLEQVGAGTELLTEAERAGSPDGYIRHTLHTEESFSVLAVVWRPGQLTEVHDHIVWCSFAVIQGAETETLYGYEGDRLVELGVVERPTGSISGVAPPDDIHRVHNTGDDVAITLHVYGANLSAGTSVRRTYDV